MALLALSGCGGDATEEGLTRVDLLLDWKPQMEQAGFVTANAKGYYRDAGLSVDMHEGQGATTTAAMVGSGQYGLGLSSGGATIIARSKGARAVSLALINQHSPTVIFALASAGINEPADLVGKRIGLTKTGVKYDEYRALMNRLGIDRSAIEEVDLRKSVAPLLSGVVDAMLGYTEDQPVLVELQGEDVARIPMHEYGVDILSTNIIANETFVAEHADLCSAFVAASLKGWKYAVEHPEEAARAYLERYPESSPEFVRANFQQFRHLLFSEHTDSLGLGAQTLEGFAATEALLAELGIIDRRVDPGAAFTNRFLTGIQAERPLAARE